jgi:hypothetical protein
MWRIIFLAAGLVSRAAAQAPDAVFTVRGSTGRAKYPGLALL